GTQQSAAPSKKKAIDVATAFGYAGLDARQLIDKLDRLAVSERPEGLSASVRPDRLILTDSEEQEQILPLPDDKSYVSVAPYVKTTHECHFHALTSCIGELSNKPIQLTVTNTSTGEVIRQGLATTFDNGFIGLWLPRNIKARIQVVHDGHSGSAEVSTMNTRTPPASPI
ncbi:MAG TPA: CueP family metal-binding protein, partial [Marmoricola sp.]|nr:CueP family metal-binding protein [Marmoricola sp.]